MKKTIKILFVFLFTFALFSIWNKVDANSTESISMDIFVDDNGDATVTEKWRCNVTQGTEVYHPYYNLGNSEIKDLTVIDGNTEYEQLEYWKTSGTLESKANKSGINQLSDGVELCWGISQYGTHTYTAKYTITDFVSETSDAQMIYWTLIPREFSNSIGNAYIKIHTNFDIPSTTDVWGYGNYGGTAYVYDGYIEMQSDGTLEKNEYMTILVKFPLGTFNTENRLDNNFEHYYNMAEEGATKYKKNLIIERIMITIAGIITIIAFILVAAFILLIIMSCYSNGLDYGKEGKRISKNVPYFRDIPCKRDIYRAYYICYQYNIIKNKTDILGAVILKWLKDGMIRVEKREGFGKEDTIIVLTETDPEKFLESREKKLFKMLYEASKDGYLKGKEFEKWCEHSYTKILAWFEQIIHDEQSKLVQEGLIKKREVFRMKIVNFTKYKATHELKQEAIELAGLKRYLNEYTLIKNREAVEVQLFEEYLIFAQIMGIAQKVARQFKEIYPEIIEQSNFASYDYIMFINMSSHRGISAAKSAKTRAEIYSSGGGGFSSGGGGGGSFGGGGGGRRLPLRLRDIQKFSTNACQKKE